MLFAPKFHHFGMDICKRYLLENPHAKVYGLETGEYKHLLEIKEILGNNLGKLWLSSAEENRWLHTNAIDSDLLLIDSIYGDGTFSETIIADRRIGRGFVSGGSCRPDIVGNLAISHPVNIPANYVVGLYDSLEKMLDQANPRFVFCYAVAGAPAVALAKICKYRGIPFLFLNATRVGSRYTIDTCYQGLLKPISEIFESFK